MKHTTNHINYPDWLKEVKDRIRVARVKVALVANEELISFYWDLGKMISETQTAYGTGFIEQLSRDLSKEFPDMKGFSYRNLAMCRQFYQFYSIPNLQQPVADLQAADNQIESDEIKSDIERIQEKAAIQKLTRQIPGDIIFKLFLKQNPQQKHISTSNKLLKTAGAEMFWLCK
jgi:hypothetical protein